MIQDEQKYEQEGNQGESSPSLSTNKHHRMDPYEDVSMKSYSKSLRSWENIMNEEVYPAEIKQMLAEEASYLVESVRAGAYQQLVEVGCAKGANASLFANMDIKYLGVDVNEKYIDEATRVSRERRLDHFASFRVMSSHDLSTAVLAHKEMTRVLVYLPFNLFGNLARPSELVEIIKALGWDLIIFTYQENDAVKEVRHAYYTECGFDIKFTREPNYSIFYSDDGFNSRVYTHRFMKKLIKPLCDANLYKLSSAHVGSIGHVYYVRKQTHSCVEKKTQRQ